MLDDELLAKAEQLCGDLERNALPKEALRALLQRESAKRLAALGGSADALEAIPRRIDALPYPILPESDGQHQCFCFWMLQSEQPVIRCTAAGEQKQGHGDAELLFE